MWRSRQEDDLTFTDARADVWRKSEEVDVIQSIPKTFEIYGVPKKKTDYGWTYGRSIT